MKYVFIAASVLLALAAAAFLLSPSPINAAAYQPPEAPPLTGLMEPNEALSAIEVLAKGQALGPEDVDADSQGRIYGALADGRIIRVNLDGSTETLANTQGRPLGLDWDNQGNLIICDAFKGLLALNPDGVLSTLVTEVDGIPINFADDLEVAKDGMIYFSDASQRYDQKHYVQDMLEARPWGRLLRYDPNTKQTLTLLNNLYFANGIALSQEEDFVLINETYRYQITRLWLRGEKAGQTDLFASNLPGFPDGISSSGRGTFWLALATTRNPTADWLHPRPWLKNQLAKLPKWLQPKPELYGLIVELDEQGDIIRSLHDPAGDTYPFITSVQERGQQVYLGSLVADGIGRL